MGSEKDPLLAHHVTWAAVLVANGVLDLHVHRHAVAPGPADDSRHDHQRILSHKVAYAALRLACLDLKFQGCRESGEEEEDKRAEQRASCLRR